MLHFPTKNSQPKFSVTDRSRGFVKPLVLVVEDQEINADLLRQLLHKVGICCAWARNGAEAVEMFLEASPGTFQAILMDIQMPVMDGYEAVREIRSSGRADAQSIPIIALTANAFLEDAERVKKEGMNEHLPKPLDVGKMLSVLAKYRK